MNCSRCGNDIPGNNVFCGYCGSPVSLSEQEAGSSPMPESPAAPVSPAPGPMSGPASGMSPSYPFPPSPGYAPPGYVPPGHVPPGYVPPAYSPPQHSPYYRPIPNIPDYLVWSVIMAVFCQVVGWIALLFSILTIVDKNAGRYDSAMRNSRVARTMITVCGVLLAFVLLFYVAIFGIAIVTEMN